MYPTISLFDSLEADQSQQRVASRQALALADIRVERHCGRFLRAAQTEAEFWERLGLLQEDFDSLIHTAAAETNYERPNYIKEAILEHYLAAFKQAKCACGCDDGNCHCAANCTSCDCHKDKTAATVEFEEPAEDEDKADVPPIFQSNKERKQLHQEGEDPDRISSVHQATGLFSDMVNPQGAQGVTQGIQPDVGAPLMTPATGPAQSPLAINPATLQNPQGAPPGIPGADPNKLEQMVQPQQQVAASWRVIGKDWIDHAIKHPGALHEELHVPEGQKIPEDKLEEAEHSDNKKERERADLAETLKGMHHGSIDQSYYARYISAKSETEDIEPYDPSAQKSNGEGVSVLDALDESGPKEKESSWRIIGETQKQKRDLEKDLDGNHNPDYDYDDDQKRIDLDKHTVDDKANDNNTDLKGPEPKMDKDKHTFDNPPKDPLGDEDKGAHPTKRKDITVPIEADNRETLEGKPQNVLKEIGENKTQRQKLPSSTDAGFTPGGVSRQGPPYTWHNNDGQTKPVTRETQD